MFGGPLEIVLIVFVVLLFFGAKRLPAALGSLGKGMREFKHAVGDKEEDAAEMHHERGAPGLPVPPPVPPPAAPHVAAAPLHDPTEPITPLRSLGDPLAPPPAAKPSPENGGDAPR